MGGTSWSSDAYKNLSSSYATKSKDDIFKSRKISGDMSPHGIKFRESRDSDAHPESLAINLWVDVTGSMGDIPKVLIQQKLGQLMETLIKHGIEHPQVLFGGIGDHHNDQAPLQVGQYESGTEELNKWLTTIWLEAGGGGNDQESYLLAYLFASRHTSIDCFEKRNQKGFLFTVGDERSWDTLSAEKMKELMGYEQAQDITIKELLNEVQRTYHVFHIHANSTGYKDNPTVINFWKDLLGQRLIILDDYTILAEIVASTVALVHGVDLKKVTSSFDSKTAIAVEGALVHIKSDVAKTDNGVINL